MAARRGHIGESTDDLGPHNTKRRRAAQRSVNLSALDLELSRLIRRAGRQRQQIRTGVSSEAWLRWSANIAEGVALVARIERAPAHDLAGLAIKFRAILWRIQTDEGVIMDQAVSGSLSRFGRQLARLARN